MKEEVVQRWVNTGGVVIAALALALGLYTVAWGPDSIMRRIEEMRIQDERAACFEGIAVVSALATEIHDSTVADARKSAFRAFRSGKVHLVKDGSVKRLVD